MLGWPPPYVVSVNDTCVKGASTSGIVAPRVLYLIASGACINQQVQRQRQKIWITGATPASSNLGHHLTPHSRRMSPWCRILRLSASPSFVAGNKLVRTHTTSRQEELMLLALVLVPRRRGGSLQAVKKKCFCGERTLLAPRGARAHGL